MNNIVKYISDTLGIKMELQQAERPVLNQLPMYLREGYKWQIAKLEEKPCLLAIVETESGSRIAQIAKHFEIVKEIVGLPVIAIFDHLEAYNRKRLIEKRVAFIVPGKQLYAPDLLIDLREQTKTIPIEADTLTPVAQQLLLVFILDKYNRTLLQEKTFKEIAVLLQTNPMAVSRAVENLKRHELVEVKGEKEKFINFRGKKPELWNDTLRRNLFVNPVLKRVYVDALPENGLRKSNTSALPEYTDMNPSREQFYAIEKTLFYALQKNKALINENPDEGRYCLEVWKYNAEITANIAEPEDAVVDPLSLYLILKDTQDERVEMALEQIIEKHIW